MPFEYTPEINADYLKALQRPIIQQGAVNVGRARGEALRRGLEGDPFESLRVGGAINNTANSLTDTTADLAFKTAGVAQQERYGKEQLASQQAFSSAEAEKSRAFQERMQIMEQNYKAAMQRASERAQRRSFWPNLIGNVVSTGAGIYTGKKLGS